MLKDWTGMLRSEARLWSTKWLKNTRWRQFKNICFTWAEQLRICSLPSYIWSWYRCPHCIQIRDNAEYAVRNLLRDVAKTRGTKLHAKDHLDDGSPIELHVEINEEDGSAIFDFEGTGLEMIGNLNTPISVTYSAVIYCLRAMVDLDVSPPLLPLCTNGHEQCWFRYWRFSRFRSTMDAWFPSMFASLLAVFSPLVRQQL